MIKKLYRKFKSWMDYNPPGALSAKGWRLFNKEFQEQAPIRYLVRETYRQKFLYPISRADQNVYRWISDNIFSRYHIVQTGLKPGYYEVDTRMLHANFNMLKDFVECECAWLKYHYDEKDPWYKQLRISRMYRKYRFRDPKLGMEYLDWSATLDDPNLPPFEQSIGQAVAARETRELYDWWVNKRPAREHIKIPEYSDQGLDLFSCLDEDFNKDAEDYKKSQEAREKETEQTKNWFEEDDEMLIRLIKNRHSLWT